jgi:DNA-binding GntR family transcriptional regulator
MHNDAATKYQHVYKQIRDFISSGKWPLGETIPSENELVDYFNVSRITIRSALRLLADDGLIVRKRGKGTVVTNSMPQADNCFESLTQKIIKNGDTPSSEILDFQKITNDKHTEHFNKGEKLYFVKRLRKINEKPYLISNAFVSYKHAFGLSKNYFTEEGSSQSIIFILNEKFNIDFKKNSQLICAETLSSFDSLVLNKDSGIPCLAHECLLYNHTNELILVDKNITLNTIKLDQELAS